MNRSKKVLWDEVRRLYVDEHLLPADILLEIKQRAYFDSSVIPTIESIHQYLNRTGISTSRLAEKRKESQLKEELDELKKRLIQKKYDKAKALILKGLQGGELSVDDLAKENISKLQAIIQSLADKIGNARSNDDKMEVVKLLDKVVSTLLKARVLEDKPTEKVDLEVKETVLDKMRDKYLPKKVMDNIEEDMKEDDNDNG